MDNSKIHQNVPIAKYTLIHIRKTTLGRTLVSLSVVRFPKISYGSQLDIEMG